MICVLAVKDPKITAQKTGQKHLQKLGFAQRSELLQLKTAVPRRRESRIVCALSPARCKAAGLIHFPCLEGHSWELKWSSQSHSTGFVRLFILSWGVHVAIRITTIHLEGNSHLQISALLLEFVKSVWRAALVVVYW